MNASEALFVDIAFPANAPPRRRSDRSDEVLIREIVLKYPEALCLLYARYEAFVMTVARKVLLDPDDAQETLQDVFLLIWNHAERFDARRGTVKGWIGGLAYHRAIDRCRRQRREAAAREKVRVEFTRHAAEHSHPVDRNVYFSKVGGNDRAVLRDAVAGLPPEQMQTLLLTYMAGMSQREIAAHLGVTLGVVKHRLKKAMHAMMQMSDCLRGIFGN